MAGTAPTPALVAVNDGDLLTANTLNSFTTNITNLFNYTQAGFYMQKPLFFSRLAAAAGVSNNANQTVSWSTPGIDNFSMWASGSPSQITIQKAGWWRLTLLTKWDINGTGVRTHWICVNGTTPSSNAVAADNRATTGGGYEGCTCYAQTVVQLAQGATVIPVVYQNSGGSLNLVTSFGGCTFSAEWIAPY